MAKSVPEHDRVGSISQTIYAQWALQNALPWRGLAAASRRVNAAWSGFGAGPVWGLQPCFPPKEEARGRRRTAARQSVVPHVPGVKFSSVDPKRESRAIGIRIGRGSFHFFQQGIRANGAEYFQKSFMAGGQENGASLGWDWPIRWGLRKDCRCRTRLGFRERRLSRPRWGATSFAPVRQWHG